MGRKATIQDKPLTYPDFCFGISGMMTLNGGKNTLPLLQG